MLHLGLVLETTTALVDESRGRDASDVNVLMTKAEAGSRDASDVNVLSVTRISIYN